MAQLHGQVDQGGSSYYYKQLETKYKLSMTQLMGIRTTNFGCEM